MVIESQEAIDKYLEAVGGNNLRCQPVVGNVVWCNKMSIMFADKGNIQNMIDRGIKQVIMHDGELVYKSEQ